jgi:hypothetical protein
MVEVRVYEIRRRTDNVFEYLANVLLSHTSGYQFSCAKHKSGVKYFAENNVYAQKAICGCTRA